MGSTPSNTGVPNEGSATVVIVLPQLGAAATVAPDIAAAVASAALVVGVDSGIDHAFAVGLPVHVAVGDFDSVSPEGLARATAEGAEVQRHAVAKDLTDFELGVEIAVARGATRIIVLGGRGGRLDHGLANLLSLAAPALAALEVVAYLDGSRVTVIRERAELRGRPAALLSLLPVGGPAIGVRTEGLRYPLRDEDLPVGSARGVSNVFIDRDATVSLAGGVLLAIQPGPPPTADPWTRTGRSTRT